MNEQKIGREVFRNVNWTMRFGDETIELKGVTVVKTTHLECIAGTKAEFINTWEVYKTVSWIEQEDGKGGVGVVGK